MVQAHITTIHSGPWLSGQQQYTNLGGQICRVGGGSFELYASPPCWGTTSLFLQQHVFNYVLLQNQVNLLCSSSSHSSSSSSVPDLVSQYQTYVHFSFTLIKCFTNYSESCHDWTMLALFVLTLNGCDDLAPLHSLHMDLFFTNLVLQYRSKRRINGMRYSGLQR